MDQVHGFAVAVSDCMGHTCRVTYMHCSDWVNVSHVHVPPLKHQCGRQVSSTIRCAVVVVGVVVVNFVVVCSVVVDTVVVGLLVRVLVIWLYVVGDILPWEECRSLLLDSIASSNSEIICDRDSEFKLFIWGREVVLSNVECVLLLTNLVSRANLCWSVAAHSTLPWYNEHSVRKSTFLAGWLPLTLSLISGKILFLIGDRTEVSRFLCSPWLAYVEAQSKTLKVCRKTRR